MNSGSKGGVVGTLVDPTTTLAALRRLRANSWRLSQVLRNLTCCARSSGLRVAMPHTMKIKD
jgi:hypothetical protein